MQNIVIFHLYIRKLEPQYKTGLILGCGWVHGDPTRNTMSGRRSTTSSWFSLRSSRETTPGNTRGDWLANNNSVT